MMGLLLLWLFHLFCAFKVYLLHIQMSIPSTRLFQAFRHSHSRGGSGGVGWWGPLRSPLWHSTRLDMSRGPLRSPSKSTRIGEKQSRWYNESRNHACGNEVARRIPPVSSHARTLGIRNKKERRNTQWRPNQYL